MKKYCLIQTYRGIPTKLIVKDSNNAAYTNICWNFKHLKNMSQSELNHWFELSTYTLSKGIEIKKMIDQFINGYTHLIPYNLIF